MHFLLYEFSSQYVLMVYMFSTSRKFIPISSSGLHIINNK